VRYQELIAPLVVLCQISRPAGVALTWAGLIDWQTIKAS
jgi:hypothetical protein